MKSVLSSFALAAAAALTLATQGPASAHHYDHGIDGHTYILPTGSGHELNRWAATGQATRIDVIYSDASWWNLVLTGAVERYGAAIAPIAGFSPFVVDEIAFDYSVNSGNDIGVCGQGSHGCVLAPWFPSSGTGAIYMYDPAFTDCCTHMVSDLMHEMGHALWTAAEHYNTGYNCQSIMGHCNDPRIIDLQAHDIADYRSAYRIADAPDATYAQFTKSGSTIKTKHLFEGGYLGGNGRTLHAEQKYWFDRAIGSVTGTYDTYTSIPRIETNSDDTTPSWFEIADLPSQGSGTSSEWCFKVRGEAGGVLTSDSGRFGPLSRAYCIANRGNGSGSGVFVASNRNDYVGFSVWNHSGAQINNVALLLNDGQTHICDLGSIANSASKWCVSTALGAGSGFVVLWYNWANRGAIGYDAR